MPGGDWRIGESMLVAAKWGGSRYSDSLKPADAQRRCYCLTMKSSQRVKRPPKNGILGVWRNWPVI